MKNGIHMQDHCQTWFLWDAKPFRNWNMKTWSLIFCAVALWMILSWSVCTIHSLTRLQCLYSEPSICSVGQSIPHLESHISYHTFLRIGWILKQMRTIYYNFESTSTSLGSPHLHMPIIWSLVCTSHHSLTQVWISKLPAMVRHGLIVSRVVHSTVDRRITVQVDTPVDELDSSWQQLMDTTDSIIHHLRSIWVAAGQICKFYCAHCLYLRKREPEMEVDPEWYSPLRNTDKDNPFSEQLRTLPSNADPVTCCNDQTNSGQLQVPRPLRFPCKCKL